MSQLHLVRVMRERIARLGNKAALRVQQDGQWRAIGWRTLGQAMDYCAQALIRAGHQPTEMVGLYARNMPEWTQADLGILAARGVSVPIYPTSTLEQLRYIVKDAGIKLLFVGEQPQFDQALLLLKSGEINQIVTLDGTVDLRGCEQASHFQTFLVSGNHQPSEQALREREQHYRMDDLLTLIYTSGTTGEPKGVMLDFNNIAACFEMHDRRLDLGEQDVSLCMLPLSHVFERAWSYYVLYCGAENVYIRDPQKVMEVIGEVQPTVMCAVPRLYEKAYAMIQAKVAQAPRLRRALFGWATGVGLLGTRFTMEQDFYKGRLEAQFGLEVLVPAEEQRERVHRIIYDELCLGQIHEPSRAEYLAIIAELAQAGAQAVILGCTEIALLVGECQAAVPLYDTTAIHADAAVAWALE